jgi:hypothetical protein
MKTVSHAGWIGCLVLGAALAAAPAQGFPLTGEWAGNIVCQTFDGTARRVPSVGTTMKISQVGSQLTVQTEDGNGVKHYNGQSIEQTGQPLRVRALLIECRSTPSLDNYSEVVQLLGSASSRLRLQGKSILRSQSGDIGTCRWTFQRTTSANPAVTGCQ